MAGRDRSVDRGPLGLHRHRSSFEVRGFAPLAHAIPAPDNRSHWRRERIRALALFLNGGAERGCVPTLVRASEAIWMSLPYAGAHSWIHGRMVPSRRNADILDCLAAKVGFTG